jgi:hypothetical protein
MHEFIKPWRDCPGCRQYYQNKLLRINTIQNDIFHTNIPTHKLNFGPTLFTYFVPAIKD